MEDEWIEGRRKSFRRTGKLEGHSSPGCGLTESTDSGRFLVCVCWLNVKKKGGGQGGLVITSHVLFAFENDKGIATMGLFFLVWVLIGVGISDDTDLFLCQLASNNYIL